MLAIIISVLAALGCSYISNSNNLGPGAAIGYGTFGFFVAMIVVGLLVRKQSGKVQSELQGIMEEGQKRLQRKIHQFQSKPGGNPVVMQRQMEAEQKKMMQQALEFTDRFEPFKKWNVMMGRQIATMRLQFNYQLKQFEKVDAILATRSLFSGPMLMEPLAVAMKMARDYEKEDFEAAEKSFKRHVKWFRGDRGTLLYGLMSWIHVKNGETEKAHALLVKGKEVTSSEVLTRNWEHLSNANEKKFSNAGLGDEWFSLYLEKPPTPKQQRMRGNPRGKQMF